MKTLEEVLALECGLLAVGIVVVVFLIIYNFKRQPLRRNKDRQNKDRQKRNLEKDCITLPPTWTTVVEMQRHVGQVFDYDMANGKSTDDCVIIDETNNMAEVGRLYFSLMYEPQRCVLTVKLIKGENLPTISQNGSKAYVHCQIICHQAESKRSMAVKGARTYQKTYTFHLQPSDFLSHVIYFEVSRFDRFSRKYDVAHVVVALSELQAEIVELCHEKLFAKDIIRNWNMNIPHGNWDILNFFNSRKRRHPSNTDRSNDTTGMHQRDIKIRHRKSQMLWSKLGHAVRSGLFDERLFSGSESLQWDPFLIVHRYEFPGNGSTLRRPTAHHSSPRPSPSRKMLAPSVQQPELLPEEQDQDWLLGSSNDGQLDSTEVDASSSHSPSQLRVNEAFYRLVHSPSLARKGQVTSWSIPETFRLPPPPQRTHMRTVVFHSVSAIQKPHDRLHKLTSLSTSYREKILRKSRRDVAVHRGRITGRISLHKSLYLGRGTHHGSESTEIERTRKRQRKTNMS